MYDMTLYVQVKHITSQNRLNIIDLISEKKNIQKQ